MKHIFIRKKNTVYLLGKWILEKKIIMKKLFSALLALILLSAFSTAFADNFNYKKLLSDLDGYSYNETNKQWTYSEVYDRNYRGGFIAVCLEAQGEEGGNNLYSTRLYVLVLDENYKSVGEIKSIEFIINDDAYAYDSMYYNGGGSYVAIGDKGLALIKALEGCNASKVPVKIGLDDDIIVFDMNSTKLANTLRRFCRVYIKYNMNDYRSDLSVDEDMESIYPLTINGK